MDDIAKKLASSDGPVHADETYWTTDGARSFFWLHGDEKFIHFQYDTWRAGQVSRDILGDDFTGTPTNADHAAHGARSVPDRLLLWLDGFRCRCETKVLGSFGSPGTPTNARRRCPAEADRSRFGGLCLL